MADTRIIPSGPPGHRLMGHLGPFRRDILGFFARCAREYGDFVPIRLGPQRALLIGDPAAIEAIMTAEAGKFRKPFVQKMLRPLLGDALFIAEGAMWRQQRRILQPVFARERVAGYAEVVVDAAQRAAQRLQAGEARDVHPEMMRLNAAIDLRALFDLDIDGPGRVVADANDAIMAFFEQRLASLLPLPLWLPTPSNMKVRRAIAAADRFLYDRIAARRGQAEGGRDALSQLLQARDDHGAPLADRQIRDDALALLVAGQETSAVALSWALELLARHPEVDAKLHAELQATLGERAPTYDDLARLPYAGQVIQETLRLYPPIYFSGRDAIVNCEIDGRPIPAGMSILVCPWVLHRDPRYFEDPERFAPERWDKERPRPPKFAYFPFGGGARACVASIYATMKLTLALVCLTQRFRFEPVPGRQATPHPVVTLRPRDGVTLRPVPR